MPTSSATLAIAIILIGIVCAVAALAGGRVTILNITLLPPTNHRERVGLAALGACLVVTGGALLWHLSMAPNTRFRTVDVTLQTYKDSYRGRCGTTLIFVGRIGVAGEVPGTVTYLVEYRGGTPATTSLARPLDLPFTSDTDHAVSLPLIVRHTGTLRARLRIVAPGGVSTSKWAEMTVVCVSAPSPTETLVSERRLADTATQTTGVPTCVPMTTGCVQQPSKCTPAYCQELRLNLSHVPATLGFYEYYDYIWFHRASTASAFLSGLRYTERRKDASTNVILIQHNGRECNAGFVHKNVIFLWALGSCRNSLRAPGTVNVGPAAEAMLRSVRRL
jgi:hypothetical protein